MAHAVVKGGQPAGGLANAPVRRRVALPPGCPRTAPRPTDRLHRVPHARLTPLEPPHHGVEHAPRTHQRHDPTDEEPGDGGRRGVAADGTGGGADGRRGYRDLGSRVGVDGASPRPAARLAAPYNVTSPCRRRRSSRSIRDHRRWNATSVRKRRDEASAAAARASSAPSPETAGAVRAAMTA